MKQSVTIEEARGIMLDVCGRMPSVQMPVARSYGKVLAGDITAVMNIPPFERSPFDGYAFAAGDTANASEQSPAILRIIEEIPAGAFPTREVRAGTAAKILTGAPIPKGADAVTKYEKTVFTEDTVKIFERFKPGDNIVRVGEDVSDGTILARDGERVDGAMAATFAAQGIEEIPVYSSPKIGIVSTGTELAELGDVLSGGLIRDTNRYSLEGACIKEGAEPMCLGSSGDSAEGIAGLISAGLEVCDVVITTGGVSVGDYDFTAAALELLGAEILVRDIAMRPGGTCVFGRKGEKLIFCLPGNPASAMVCFYAVALSAIRRLCGRRDYQLEKIRVTLEKGFNKSSPAVRLLRGKLRLTDGVVRFDAAEQGNVVLHSLIGCDAMAIVPEGSPELPAGTVLEAYLL